MSDFYVYIIFRPNGVPCYVGKGRGKRWAEHFATKPRGRNRHMLSIIRSAGGPLPCVKTREGLTEKEAFLTEIALIAAIGRQKDGGPLTNMTDGGEGASGRAQSEDARQRISKANRGRIPSDEERRRISAAGMGRKHTAESSRKIGEANRRRKHSAESRKKMSERKFSEETRQKMREAWRGRVITDETRRKMSESALRRAPPSDETRRKLSRASTGRKPSEEARRKMSEAKRRRRLARMVADHDGVPVLLPPD